MLLYNVRCPAGCRDLALPTSLASVDTVLAGHAHYYGWRSSVGWLTSQFLLSVGVNLVAAPSLASYRLPRTPLGRSSGFPPEKSIIVMRVALQRASPEEVW
jgi:hypothetical protein